MLKEETAGLRHASCSESREEVFSHRRSISIMEWITPDFEEIPLNCEINSYASAEL